MHYCRPQHRPTTISCLSETPKPMTSPFRKTGTLPSLTGPRQLIILDHSKLISVSINLHCGLLDLVTMNSQPHLCPMIFRISLIALAFPAVFSPIPTSQYPTGLPSSHSHHNLEDHICTGQIETGTTQKQKIRIQRPHHGRLACHPCSPKTRKATREDYRNSP